MKHPQRIYFDKLKEEISGCYRQINPSAPDKIENWNGKTIEAFQEDLQKKVRSAISLRWFYMHIKAENEDKIPRTDVLDLLCQYADYAGWDDFVAKKKAEGIGGDAEVKIEVEDKKQVESRSIRSKLMPIMMAAVLIVILVVVWAMARRGDDILCRFQFADSDMGKAILHDKIEVTVMQDKESPKIVTANDSGCVTLHCKPGKLTFVVNAEYYHPDTVTRTITTEFQPETIKLKSDDYALMISIFSRSNIDDWEKRRKQLDEMFTDDARIFQVYPSDKRGMEMYNKDEFIDKLTMPLNSLKNIEVIESIYKNGRISALRFIQKEDTK